MMLRILSIAYPLAPVRRNAVGGAEQILAEIDAALVERGHRSLVIACEGSQTKGELIALPHIGGPLDASAVDLARARLARRIREVLASSPIDLIHMHGYDFHHYLPPAGIPLLVTLHLPLSHYPREALLPGRPDSWLNCVSAVQHQAVEDHPSMLPPIENGVRARETEAQTRRGFALMLTRICPEKGVHNAIDATKLAGVPLIICGETFPYPGHLRYFDEEIAPRLDALRRFIGPVGGNRKSWLLGAARCLLIPSTIAETSSLVAREALAAGTPVIAWRSGALPDVVDHGRTGFLVDDVEAMGAAIHRTHELSPADCYAAARDRFPLDRMIEGYLSAYRTILARAGNRHAKAGAA
jgi:glycosyltransferase involved in cell wall biosynthesis